MVISALSILPLVFTKSPVVQAFALFFMSTILSSLCMCLAIAFFAVADTRSPEDMEEIRNSCSSTPTPRKGSSELLDPLLSPIRMPQDHVDDHAYPQEFMANVDLHSPSGTVTIDSVTPRVSDSQ